MSSGEQRNNKSYNKSQRTYAERLIMAQWKCVFIGWEQEHVFKARANCTAMRFGSCKSEHTRLLWRVEMHIMTLYIALYISRQYRFGEFARMMNSILERTWVLFRTISMELARALLTDCTTRTNWFNDTAVEWRERLGLNRPCIQINNYMAKFYFDRLSASWVYYASGFTACRLQLGKLIGNE